MGVVSHSRGVLGGDRDGGGGWYACMTKPGFGHMLGDAGALPECEVNTLMTRNHNAFHVPNSARVESELVGLPGRPQHETPRVHHGCTL